MPKYSNFHSRGRKKTKLNEKGKKCNTQRVCNIVMYQLYIPFMTQLLLDQPETGMKSQMKYIRSNYAICIVCPSVWSQCVL